MISDSNQVLNLDPDNPRYFTEFKPGEVADVRLPHPGIVGPLTFDGTECPWPWDPLLLREAPEVGQMYECPHCKEMTVLGMPHVDYRNFDEGAAIRRETKGI